MSRARVAVLKVISKELTVTDAAAEYGYSRQHLHRLLTRYKTDGIEAVDPQPRRPKTRHHATSDEVRDLIVKLRLNLTAGGWDAGPVTIAWHLEQAGHQPPSTSTIRRILHTAGLITPQPQKRPRSSWHRFQADQPNECWQSDFTHYRLANGTDAEIINWLDDHSRYLLGCTPHVPVTGDIVVQTFLATAETHGLPAQTLTDNGRVYTARFGGGRNAFEYLIAALGIRQKNGSASHPQTQGKVERFHQTQNKWLAARPAAATLRELQQLLDDFRHHYNTQRPHRAINRRTPEQAYTALPKTAPAGHATSTHHRLRYDHVDHHGKVSIRRAGRMHHLGVGAAHRSKEVLAILDEATATVIELRTGEILSTHTIDPDKSYWPNTQRSPGRWPGPP